MQPPSPNDDLRALRHRDRRTLYVAGAAINLGAVLPAAALEFEPQFASVVVLLALVGPCASWVFRRLRMRRLPVNMAIVLVSAVALALYVYQSPWMAIIGPDADRRGLLGISTVEAYSLLIRAITILTVCRTFGLLGDRDVVLSILPSLSVLILIGLIRPQGAVLPCFVLFAIGTAVALLLERRLQRLSLPHQLGSAADRRRALPLSLRTLTVLACLATTGAYGLTRAFEDYQPESALMERYGADLAWLIADLVTEHTRFPQVGLNNYVDLRTTRGSLRNTVLFEVEAPQAAYWRTGTVDRYDGRNWIGSRAQGQRKFSMTEGGVWVGRCQGDAANSLLYQTITARSPLVITLPCAHRPVWVEGDFDNVRMTSGGQLANSGVIHEGESYSVRSCLADPGSYARANRDRYLALPDLPADVINLAREVTRDCHTPEDKAQRLNDFIRDRCRYTLRPRFPPAGRDLTSYFLFESRRGYCTHFASAMAVCLRIVGVPSRIALGFAPGELDAQRRTYVVREKDAHAWVEAWLPNRGWVAFDPTYGTLLGPREDRPLFARVRSALSALPRRLRFGRLAWASADWRRIGLYSLPVAVLLALVAALALTARRARTRTPLGWEPLSEVQRRIATQYARAATLLARRLTARNDTQTPHEYADVVMQASSPASAPFTKLTDLYAECRYSPHEMTEDDADSASRWLRETRRALRRLRRR